MLAVKREEIVSHFDAQSRPSSGNSPTRMPWTAPSAALINEAGQRSGLRLPCLCNSHSPIHTRAQGASRNAVRSQPGWRCCVRSPIVTRIKQRFAPWVRSPQHRAEGKTTASDRRQLQTQGKKGSDRGLVEEKSWRSNSRRDVRSCSGAERLRVTITVELRARWLGCEGADGVTRSRTHTSTSIERRRRF